MLKNIKYMLNIKNIKNISRRLQKLFWRSQRSLQDFTALLTKGLQACNFIKKRLQHRCFPVKFAKFLRTHFLKNSCERLLLSHWSLSILPENRKPELFWCFQGVLKETNIAYISVKEWQSYKALQEKKITGIMWFKKQPPEVFC